MQAVEALQTQLHAHEVHCGGAVGQLVQQLEGMHAHAADAASRTHHLERAHRQVTLSVNTHTHQHAKLGCVGAERLLP